MLVFSTIHSMSFMNEVYFEYEISSSDAAYKYSCLILSIVWMMMEDARLHAVCTSKILILWEWSCSYLHSHLPQIFYHQCQTYQSNFLSPWLVIYCSIDNLLQNTISYYDRLDWPNDQCHNLLPHLGWKVYDQYFHYNTVLHSWQLYH